MSSCAGRRSLCSCASAGRFILTIAIFRIAIIRRNAALQRRTKEITRRTFQIRIPVILTIAISWTAAFPVETISNLRVLATKIFAVEQWFRDCRDCRSLRFCCCCCYSAGGSGGHGRGCRGSKGLQITTFGGITFLNTYLFFRAELLLRSAQVQMIPIKFAAIAIGCRAAFR